MTKDVNFVIERAMMAVFGDGGVPVDATREERRAKALLGDAGGLVKLQICRMWSGTVVVRHITPLIHCTSGCEHLARESQPL